MIQELGKGGDIRLGQTNKRLDCGVNFSHCLVAALMFLHPFFGDLLPGIITKTSFIFGSVIVVCFFLKHRSFDLASIGRGAMWLTLGAFALVSHLATSESPKFIVLVLVVSVLLMCMCSCSTDWIRSALYTALAMLSVHMVATVFFYFAPEAYSQVVKPIFFAEYENAIGYQSGLTNHYSDNGQMLAIGLIVSFSCLLFREGDRKPILLFVLTALFLFALVLTQKRAHLGFGLLALFVALGIASPKNRALKIIVLACLLVVSVAVANAFYPGIASSLERLLGTFESTSIEGTLSGRMLLWEEAVGGWLKSPWFGNGWSSFYYIWPSGLTVSIYAHNEILQLLYEAGIVGAVLFVFVALSTLAMSFNIANSIIGNPACSIGEKRAITFSCAYQVFGLVYGCTTGSLLQMATTVVPYFTALAIAFAYRYFMKQHQKVLADE